jgi:hypothetical protein
MFCYSDLEGNERAMPPQSRDVNSFLPASFAQELMARSPSAAAVSLGYRLMFTSSRINPFRNRESRKKYKKPKWVQTDEQKAQFWEQLDAKEDELAKLFVTTDGTSDGTPTEQGLADFSFALWKSCLYDHLVPFRRNVAAILAQKSDSVPITDLLVFIWDYHLSHSIAGKMFKSEAEVKGKWLKMHDIPRSSGIPYLNGVLFTERTKSVYVKQVERTELDFETYKMDLGVETMPAVLKKEVCDDSRKLDALGELAKNYILAFIDERMGNVE